MTKEKIIEKLESLYDYCQNMKSGDDNLPVWEDDCKALKIALTALRLVSREQVEMLERLGIEVKKVRP